MGKDANDTITGKPGKPSGEDPAGDKRGGTRVPLLPEEARQAYRSVVIDDLRKTDPRIPIRRAAAVHATAFGTLWAVAATADASSIAFAAGSATAAIILAPLYRGLENLVHGAAHRDIVRDGGEAGRQGKGGANDLIGDMLCAMPVGQDVLSFRKRHLGGHHGNFDQDVDPCRDRMLGHADVTAGRLPSFRATVADLPREIAAFYRTVGGAPRFALRGAAWHALAYGLPLALLTSPAVAAAAWLSVFLPLFTLTLPLVRSVAEAGEHDYRPEARGLSLAERTFAHDGWRNRIFHLFDDDLHPEHHLWPNIPQYRLRRVRDRAIQAGLARHLRRRTEVLGRVERYA